MSDSRPAGKAVAISERREGWFPATRSQDALELIRLNPLAFVLAYIIAWRARWHSGFNRYSLELGEAMLGDFKDYHMTEQQYRTAKRQLEKAGFATFHTTNRGTIARLTDKRLFEISALKSNDPTNSQRTNSQRATNDKPTTEQIEEFNKVRKEGHALRAPHSNEIPFEQPTEERVWEYVTELENEDQLQMLDVDFVESFINQHQRDGWTIRGEPIRFWRSALRAYCGKLENDRSGGIN